MPSKSPVKAGSVAFDVQGHMDSLKLEPCDLEALTGVHRGTVWRWRAQGRCPPYVKTILEQQQRIRRLAAALADSPPRRA